MAKPYIATEPIFVNGSLGYAAGDPVADEVVERLGVQSSVAREGSKSAASATEGAAEGKPAAAQPTPHAK